MDNSCWKQISHFAICWLWKIVVVLWLEDILFIWLSGLVSHFYILSGCFVAALLYWHNMCLNIHAMVPCVISGQYALKAGGCHKINFKCPVLLYWWFCYSWQRFEIVFAFNMFVILLDALSNLFHSPSTFFVTPAEEFPLYIITIVSIGNLRISFSYFLHSIL